MVKNCTVRTYTKKSPEKSGDFFVDSQSFFWYTLFRQQSGGDEMTLSEARKIARVIEFEKSSRFINGTKAYKIHGTEEYEKHNLLMQKADSYRTYYRIQVHGCGMYSAGFSVRSVIGPLGLIELNEPMTDRTFKRDELFAFTHFGWQAHGFRAYTALRNSVHGYSTTVVELTGTPVYKDWWQVALKPEKTNYLTDEQVLSTI